MVDFKNRENSMEETKVGIKETKEVCDLVVDIAKVILEAKKNDGKFSIEDIGLLLKLIPSLSPAFADMNKIPAELKDLSAEEGIELISHVATRLGLEEGKAKNIVEASLKTLVSVYALVVAIKN